MLSSSLLLAFLVRILSFAFAVYITARIMPGIQIKSLGTAIWVSITYAFLNFVVFEVFGIISLPFGLLTLGIGFWFLNALMLLITDRLIDGFRVRGLFTAAFASLLIALLNGLIVRFIGLWDGHGSHIAVPSINV